MDWMDFTTSSVERFFFMITILRGVFVMTPVLDTFVSGEKGWHISFVLQLAAEHVY